MTTSMVKTNEGDVMEAVVAQGDLAKLTSSQRVQWYKMRCEAAGLDPRTQPFQYITLQGKLTLYATKTATEQLCAVRNISTEIIGRERMDDLYIVTCRATTTGGRHTDSIGAVTIANLKGDMLANALMKAETKAKRRAVLALCGLGMLDETEAETVPGAQVIPMDAPTDDPEAVEIARGVPGAVITRELDTATGETTKETLVIVPPAGNGGSVPRTGRKSASVQTPEWFERTKAFAAEVPYFQTKDGQPDRWHMLGAAAKLGIDTVTAANLDEVLGKLREYASQHADAEAA